MKGSTEEHLRTLELDNNASWKDVQKAYREMLKVWHPDRFSSSDSLQEKAEERTRNINACYEALSKDWEQWTKKRERNSVKKEKQKIDLQQAQEFADVLKASHSKNQKTIKVNRILLSVVFAAMFFGAGMLILSFDNEKGPIKSYKNFYRDFFRPEKKKGSEPHEPINWRKIDSLKKTK